MRKILLFGISVLIVRSRLIIGLHSGARMVLKLNSARKCFRDKSKNLKREELSLLLGFDNSYISKLERKSINITIDKLEQIANIFEIDVIDLLKQ